MPLVFFPRPIGREGRLCRCRGKFSLSLDGEPAVAVDYFVTATASLKGTVTHVRQALAKHGPWVFFIRDIALPAQYAPSLGAFSEVLGNWHWL